MKKQIISLLTLMVAFASASFAEDELSVPVSPVEYDSVAAIVDSVAAMADSAVTTTNLAAAKLESLPEEVTDSVAADTADPYVPYSEGLLFRPEVGGGKMVFSNRVESKLNFDITAGLNAAYQFNANLSVGWGVSFYYCSMKIEDFDELLAWNPTLKDEYEEQVYRLPIYISARWKFLPRKVTPFLDGRFGYAVGLNTYSFKVDQSDPGITTENHGLFLEFGAGLHYKSFSVALVLDRLACKDSNPEYRELAGWKGINSNYHDVYLGLKLGFDVTFKNVDKEEEVEEENVFDSSSKKQ
ncbi:MAG: hypothetical protein IKP27_04620 [Paludibacteraceae bacterium]|nr:hypothetical protein [Paludibacteraceae bacterium]